MNSTSGENVPGAWAWWKNRWAFRNSDINNVNSSESRQQFSTSTSTTEESTSHSGTKPKRYWKPRTCRICLDTVMPTFHPPSEHLPSFMRGEPTVTYDSEDGRLIRPCKCRGTSKYVHEECLRKWRHVNPNYGKRNYWVCPTCGFNYRLERMLWGRILSSKVTQLLLTIACLILAVFILGFFADPVINMYLDPYGTLSPFSHRYKYVEDLMNNYEDPVPSSTWSEHFIKGFASLGLLSFLKMFITSPWHWLNFRGSGFSTGRRRGGRDRLANISWTVVIIGVLTFLVAIWRGTRAWSHRTLNKMSERVMDVQCDDGGSDDDEQDDDHYNNSGTSSARETS